MQLKTHSEPSFASWVTMRKAGSLGACLLAWGCWQGRGTHQLQQIPLSTGRQVSRTEARVPLLYWAATLQAHTHTPLPQEAAASSCLVTGTSRACQFEASRSAQHTHRCRKQLGPREGWFIPGPASSPPHPHEPDSCQRFIHPRTLSAKLFF